MKTQSTPATPRTSDAPAQGAHLLVVIDHRQARIYKTELHGTVPHNIIPYDPHGFGRQLHYVQDDATGKRKPELKSFYEAVIKTLQNATQILLFGNGTGESSAMVHLVAEIKRHHPQLAPRIIGQVTLDPHHISEDQLLAAARTFYSKLNSGSGKPA